MCVWSLSCVQLCAIPWTVAHQAPQTMEFFRQEYQSGVPFPAPGALPDPGIEPASLASLALAGGFFTIVTLGKPISIYLPIYLSIYLSISESL